MGFGLVIGFTELVQLIQPGTGHSENTVQLLLIGPNIKHHSSVVACGLLPSKNHCTAPYIAVTT
jgi:hypothetical protein